MYVLTAFDAKTLRRQVVGNDQSRGRCADTVKNADTPSPVLLKHLPEWQGGMQQNASAGIG